MNRKVNMRALRPNRLSLIVLMALTIINGCGGGGGGGGVPTIGGGSPTSGGGDPGTENGTPSTGGSDPIPEGGSSGSTTPSILAPIANAGSDLSSTGKVFQLNGANSSDPNNLPLSYSWSVTSKPLGSSCTLDNSTIATPKVTVDKYGAYVLTLTANNGTKSSSSAVTITYERIIEYSKSVADGSVSMISDHWGIDGYSEFSNGYYYDTSIYTSLETSMISSNGIRVAKITLANDSSEKISDYDSSNYIYRTCLSGSICLLGYTHKTDKDKVWIQRLNHVSRSASEFIITSTKASDNYVAKSIWNLVVLNNQIYLYRNLFTSLNVYSQGPVDVEIMKLNSNLELLWDKVIQTSGYGTSPNAVVNLGYNSVYSPWIYLQLNAGKLMLMNTVSGGRQGNDEIIINESTGSVESVYQFLVYESNVLVGNRSIYPKTGANGKVYFSNFYNMVTKTKFSTVNGALFFGIDSNFNPTSATAVTSNDANYYIHKSGDISSFENTMLLDVRDNITGDKIASKKAYLEFNSDLTVSRISVIDNLLEDFWGTFVDTLLNSIFKMKINGSYYAAQLAYTDVLTTKAYNLTPLAGNNKKFLSLRYNSNYTGNGSLEVNDQGLHPGCLVTANSDTTTSTLSFTTKVLEVRRTSYDTPSSSSRTVSISNHPRTVVVDETEERAPWLCSQYAVDLDLTLRVKAGTTVSPISHADGHYRYEIITPPGKGELTIYQPANFSATGNTIVQYKANANATGTDSFTLRALDGTGSKSVTVSVFIK